jgi:hypothetical protein
MPINVENLEMLLIANREKLTIQQALRQERLVHSLIEGAPSCQLLNLPSVCCRKCEVCYVIHGQNDTDTVAGWVEKGYAAGPFEQPPLNKFRVNSLLAATNSGKVRPVLDV